MKKDISKLSFDDLCFEILKAGRVIDWEQQEYLDKLIIELCKRRRLFGQLYDHEGKGR